MTPPVVHNDKKVVIRKFRPQDEGQIKDLFVAGIIPAAGRLARRSLLHPPAMLVLASWAGAVAAFTKRASSAALAVLLPVATLHLFTYVGFKGYTTESIKSDLSNIEEVYLKPGGCFLVAVDAQDENKIVGMVAGEKKGDKVFELRRMSVASGMQRRGIGEQLIRELEKVCGSGKMELSTTSAMPAARALYEKYGFTLKRRSRPTEAVYRYVLPLEIHFYEKDF